ncbi:MAG: DUF5658 family protein [Infirmifilum sp.]
MRFSPTRFTVTLLVGASDMASTLLALSAGGVEMNPLLRHLMSLGAVGWALIAAENVALALLLSPVPRSWYFRIFFTGLYILVNIFRAVAVVNNLMIWLAGAELKPVVTLARLLWPTRW